MKGSEHPGQCPLCGADNHCAVAAGTPPERCWCHAFSFDSARLAEVPQAQRGRCICECCARPIRHTAQGHSRER